MQPEDSKIAFVMRLLLLCHLIPVNDQDRLVPKYWRLSKPSHQRSFSVVSANSANTSAPIQKRAITFDSDQPISSK